MKGENVGCGQCRRPRCRRQGEQGQALWEIPCCHAKEKAAYHAAHFVSHEGGGLDAHEVGHAQRARRIPVGEGGVRGCGEGRRGECIEHSWNRERGLAERPCLPARMPACACLPAWRVKRFACTVVCVWVREDECLPSRIIAPLRLVRPTPPTASNPPFLGHFIVPPAQPLHPCSKFQPILPAMRARVFGLMRAPAAKPWALERGALDPCSRPTPPVPLCVHGALALSWA